MQTALLAALAVLAQTPAPTGPLEGRWAPPNMCRRPVGDIDGATLIHGQSIDRYELHCDWQGLKPTTAHVWSASGACVLDGARIPGELRFTLNPAGDLNIVLKRA